MGKRAKLLGKQFGKLVVKEFCGVRNGRSLWRCLCSCGVEIHTTTNNLSTGQTKSCGCLVKSPEYQETLKNRLLPTIGSTFGRLTVVECLGSDHNNQRVWKCECDCGKFTKTTTAKLTGGRVKSCGCLRISHGMSKSPLYKVWTSIRSRSDEGYADFFEGWKEDFSLFANYCKTNFIDVETLIIGGYEIDRINGLEGYNPGNIRFISKKDNSRNKLRSNYIKFADRNIHLYQFLEEVKAASGRLEERDFPYFASGLKTKLNVVTRREILEDG